jgi:uncharacterized protein YndB with AHSA1/START domain
VPDIRHAILIDAPLETVHALVSTGAGFSRWWAADVIEDGAAGAVELGFFKRSTIYRLEPVRIAAPAVATWVCQTGKEWTGTTISFKLSQNEGRTLVRFEHAHWQAETDYFVSCNTTWGGLMFRLKTVAEGKPSGPLFSANGMAY